MLQSLPELADYIRKNLPYPKAILNLRVQDQAGGVVFIWQGVEFLVKLTLQAFEIRGNSIYVTGLSMLLQSALLRGDQDEQRLTNVLNALGDAEDLIRTKSQPTEGVRRLKAVREHLMHMVAPK
jgi:hypothetical protein